MYSKERNGFHFISTTILSAAFFVTSISYAATPLVVEPSTTASVEPSTATTPTVEPGTATAESNASKDGSQPVVSEDTNAVQTDDNTLVADDTDIPELTADEAAYNKDPLERINRAFFVFNDKLDFYLIKPIAQVYNAVMPKPLNKGIHNFFNNLGEIPTIANDFLQFNFYQMTKDTYRLVINSTLGFGGLFDIATRMHIPYFQNDFGLTLAKWGYKNSSYLVLPILGSNTIRDGIGIPVDYFEFSVYPYVRPQSTRYQLLGLFMVDHRAHLLQFEPVLEEAAIDRYVFMRNAYMQHRAFQIEQVKHLSYKDRDENQNPENWQENKN